jgi:3-oxoadipate CoA-transferase alpha subunit
VTLVCASTDEAVEGIADGSTVLVSGFGGAGMPYALLAALVRCGARELTVVNNNAGNGDTGLAALLAAGQVRKVICSYPRQTDSYVFDELYRAGKVELEVVPQGTLAERLRAAGAGIPAFFTPTGANTLVAEGKEVREYNGRACVLEEALHGDVALIEAWMADRWGNLVFRDSSRNFNPIMAMAGELTIVQTHHLCDLGQLPANEIVTPGIFVDRVLHVPAGDPKLPA